VDLIDVMEMELEEMKDLSKNSRLKHHLCTALDAEYVRNLEARTHDKLKKN
jgi:hypothetical protein